MSGWKDKLIGFLETNGAIAGEDREVYEYTLKIIAILGGNIMISLLIGFGLGVPLYCMMLLFSIIVLRSDAGGYHADNMWVCYFLSCMGLMGALLWIKAEIPYQALITVCMAVPSYFFVFRNAPLEAENKPLAQIEKKIIGRRARIIVTVEMAAVLICLVIDKKSACTIMCSVIWCAIGYIGWFMKKKRKLDMT